MEFLDEFSKNLKKKSRKNLWMDFYWNSRSILIGIFSKELKDIFFIVADKNPERIFREISGRILKEYLESWTKTSVGKILKESVDKFPKESLKQFAGICSTFPKARPFLIWISGGVSGKISTEINERISEVRVHSNITSSKIWQF